MGGESKGDAFVLSGEYEHSVDEKGRVTLPVKMRALLGEVVFLTRGLDGCLCIYPEKRWADLVERSRSLPVARRTTRVLRRMLCSGNKCAIDRSGRILLPAVLRGFADIQNRAVIVGLVDRVEIWSPLRWEKTVNLWCEEQCPDLSSE